MKTTFLLIGTALLLNLPGSLSAAGCGHGATGPGCCGGSPSTASPSPGHAEHSSSAAVAPSAATPAPGLPLSGTPKFVFTNYLTVQAALAQDSLDEVAASAATLAQAVRADTAGTFPPQVAEQADALAQAKNLSAAREAFRPLSDSLVQFVKAGNVPPGMLYEVYCPMAKASWLQVDKTVRNPYLGGSMRNCGQVKG